MATDEPTPTPRDPTPTSPVPPKRKRRRWVRIVLVLAVLLVGGAILLAALAPTILSTGPATNLILAQVNQRLNGKVAVGSLSLGWTSGVRVDGLRVFDEAGTQIAQVEHLTCPMPLWKAATGSYPLGHTVIDGLAFDAKYDDQGRLNFSRLAKPSPNGSNGSSGKSSSGDSKLPDVSGDIEIKDSRGTVSKPGQPTLFLTALAAKLDIPNINAAITDHVDAAAHVGDGGHDGHLTLDGTVDAITANRVALDTAKAHQDAKLTGLDLAAVKPFLPPSAKIDTLTGIVDGHLLLDVPDGKSATLDAALTGTQPVAFGGPLLKGDTLRTDTFSAAVSKASATFPDGLGHWQSGHVVTGDPMAIKVDQGQVTLAADLVPQGVLNLLAGHAPGSAGKLDLKLHADAGKLASQLKHTMAVSDDVTLTGGTLDSTVAVALTSDRGTIKTDTDLTDVAGTRDGKPVSVQPVHLSAAAADIGGANVVDGLRDLSLKLTSKFANADFHGSNVGDLAGTLTAQLQQLQAEAAQFHDFGDTKLAGDLTVKLNNKGQLMAAPHEAKADVDVLLTDLSYADKTGPRVRQPRVHVSLTGDLHGSEKAVVERITDAALTVAAGSADAPTVELAANSPSVSLSKPIAADFTITKLGAKLAELQKQFANVPPGQAGTVVQSGTLTGTSAGHYGDGKITLKPTTLTIAGLTVARQLPNNQRVTAITNDTLNVSLAGLVGLGDTKTVDLSALTVVDTGKIVDIHKGDGPLTITKAPTAIGGRGQLAVMINLAKATAVQRVLGRTEVADQTPAGRVTSGTLTGTLTFAAAESGKTDVTGDFTIPNLAVASATGPGSGPQKVTITLKATSENTTLTVDDATVTAPFATAAITKATLDLAPKSAVNKVRAATVAVDVSDLKTLDALLNAFSSPAKPAPGEKPVPPLVVTAGTFTMRADVSRDGDNLVLNVPTVKADNVAFTRGSASYQMKPVTAKLVARAGTIEGENLSIPQQLSHLNVTQFDADVGIATVALTKPITVADLSHPADAAGGIKVDGDVAESGRLAAAYAAGPADAYPYRGHFTLTQDLTGTADSLALAGSMLVKQFQVMQGSQVQFAEDDLAVANDVALPADLNAVGIRSLTVDFKSSDALHLSIANGRVDDLKTQRQLNVPVTVKYDLAKLWPIVHPMLLTPGKPDQYADVKVAGTFTRVFVAKGSYPAGAAFADAVKPLMLDGGLAVGHFEYSGITVDNLDVPFTMRAGQLVTVDGAGNVPPPATANGGQLDLGHLTVDLTRSPPRLTTAADKVVLTNVTINPIFAHGVLGKIINNPVFVGAQQATGLVSLRFERCDALPLGDLVKQNVPANDGSATIRFSMKNVHIGLPDLAALSDALDSSSFETQVNDAEVRIAHGVEQQRIAFVSGPYTVGFDGSVRLADDAFVPMTVTLPIAAVLRKQGVIDANLKKYLPDNVPIALRGTASAPQLAIDEVAGQLVQQAGQKAVKNGVGDLLDKQLNKATGGKVGGGGNDPIGGIIGGILGNKKGK